MTKGRASVDRLIAATRAFLDCEDHSDSALEPLLFRMQHAATLERCDRRVRYDLCKHMFPNGYCVTCREEQ